MSKKVQFKESSIKQSTTQAMIFFRHRGGGLPYENFIIKRCEKEPKQYVDYFFKINQQNHSFFLIFFLRLVFPKLHVIFCCKNQWKKNITFFPKTNKENHTFLLCFSYKNPALVFNILQFVFPKLYVIIVCKNKGKSNTTSYPKIFIQNHSFALFFSCKLLYSRST